MSLGWGPVTSTLKCFRSLCRGLKNTARSKEICDLPRITQPISGNVTRTEVEANLHHKPKIPIIVMVTIAHLLSMFTACKTVCKGLYMNCFQFIPTFSRKTQSLRSFNKLAKVTWQVYEGAISKTQVSLTLPKGPIINLLTIINY